MFCQIILVLFFSFASYFLNAQKFSFKGELVDTISIHSDWGYFHFDSCGTTTGIYDEFILAYNEKEKQYKILVYKQTEYKYMFRPLSKDFQVEIIDSNKTINQTLISNLLIQLQQTYIKPTFENSEISKKEFDKLTSKKEILQIAKRFDVDWKFNNDYSTKKENDFIFNSCQSIDTFNIYLASSFDTTSSYIFVTDYSDDIEIEITTENKTYIYKAAYPSEFKQPWFIYSELDFFDSGSILNFSINSALVELLPKKFSRIQTLKNESLIQAYIIWYLKRKKIIF